MQFKVEIHTTLSDRDIILWQDFEITRLNGIEVINDPRFLAFQEKILTLFRKEDPDVSIDISGSDSSVDFDFCDGLDDYSDLKKLDIIFNEFEKEFAQ